MVILLALTSPSLALADNPPNLGTQPSISGSGIESPRATMCIIHIYTYFDFTQAIPLNSTDNSALTYRGQAYLKRGREGGREG
jgi:hypothetical protein